MHSTTTDMTHADTKRATVERCPEFLYTTTDQHGRQVWAFAYATCRTLDEAYRYARDEVGS